MNREFPDAQGGFRKGRGIRLNCQHLLDNRKRELQKNIYFCLTSYAKAFNCVDHNKLWKILKEMGIPDHLTCLLKNLYAGKEATCFIHETMDWLQTGKGIHQGCILSPCLFNFYSQYIMRNAGLEETQARIKIVGRNINNLRNADDYHSNDQCLQCRRPGFDSWVGKIPCRRQRLHTPVFWLG